MIEIYVGGNIYYESNMAIDDFYKLIMDNFINPDIFIEIPLSDGNTAYIKKAAVISFNNLIEPVN